GSAHFFLLPFIEQSALYQRANGNSWNVRTEAVKIFACPLDPTAPNARFSDDAVNYSGNGRSVGTTSVNGGIFGATSYAINGRAGRVLVVGQPGVRSGVPSGPGESRLRPRPPQQPQLPPELGRRRGQPGRHPGRRGAVRL